jgi:DNA repair protein RecN (Recombination protein N)
MLRFLRIKRLAVIDAAEVEFGAGLNVLTGETGAGKSILVEAVGLLLGGRASGDLVRTGEESALIEAIFESDAEEWVVRREVTAQGRSRAFVNGELTTAGALKDLSARLIEIHGQHEHHTLLDSTSHLAVLDSYAGFDYLNAPVATCFDAMRSCEDALGRTRQASAEHTARQELIAFQLGEIDRGKPLPGEDEDLGATRQVLMNAERVERLCRESYSLLYESEHAVLAQLGGVWRRVGDLAAIDPTFQSHVDARDGIKSQLEDLAFLLRRYGSSIDASPARLQEIEQRLAVLERLKRKYGPAMDDVIARGNRLRVELEEIGTLDQKIEVLARELEQRRIAYVEAATALSSARRAAAGEFAQQLERLVTDLAMGGTRFEVRFGEPMTQPAWTARGIDALEFFVSPNPGEELRPLARIVSGGELSRIMLAIKTLTATRRLGFSDADDRRPSGAAPGLIFDEVDAGIGGRAADIVGRKLRSLGSVSQVLCITHLPQIAAYADMHFAIDKRVEDGRTHTRVTRLDEPGRIDELARMLGGEAITDGLRGSAREMLMGRQATPRSGDSAAAKAGSESTSKGESERAKAKPLRRPGVSARRSKPSK